MSELRKNPITGEWVITATHRQERTYIPPADMCPLCPTLPGCSVFQTEIPGADWGVAVFDNRFPSLVTPPPEPVVSSHGIYEVEPSRGVCEVVVYSTEHARSFGDLSVPEAARIVEVWADRYVQLGRRDDICYVMPFENRGRVIGVTLDHPHGQIYGFPFVPPIPARELEGAERYSARTGHCVWCDVVAQELADGQRVVCASRSFVAVVPFFARFPYEVHVLHRGHAGALNDLSERERVELAALLLMVVRKYDSLFGFVLPYIMVVHQRPTHGLYSDVSHLHVEFYPPNRTRDKLKYLAGCESGAGTYINDTVPEEKAAELRLATPASFEDLDRRTTTDRHGEEEVGS